MPEIAHGCCACKSVFQISVYCGESKITTCPLCGGRDIVLFGTLPKLVHGDGKYYFIDGLGRLSGGYPTKVDASKSLWRWFTGDHSGSQEEDVEEKGHKEVAHLRVVRDDEGGA